MRYAQQTDPEADMRFATTRRPPLSIWPAALFWASLFATMLLVITVIGPAVEGLSRAVAKVVERRTKLFADPRLLLYRRASRDHLNQPG